MMNQVAQHLRNEEKRAVEVVVHISKDLGDEQRNLVVSELEKTVGIIGAEFCPSRNHLVLAKYDKDIFSSQDVLKHFNSMNLEARLIGPI
jgi:cell division protein FtsX